MGGGQVGVDDKFELPDVADENGVSEPDARHDDAASVLVKQTRTRRLFSSAQLFSFSLMYLITWAGMGVNMYYAILNGGPRAYLFNYIIVIVGVLGQAACFAELASIIPIAGAQYYWTYQYAPPKMKRFICWIQGWSTWLGYIACLASSLNTCVVQLEAAIQINSPNYVNGGWHTTLIILAELVFLTTINVWFFGVVPWFELATGVVNVCFFIITLVALWVMSPRNPASFILSKSNLGGWNNDYISWNVGMLTQIWQFIGFECVVHMGEETKHATRAAPRAMFWSVAANGVLGFVMVITYIICMPPLETMMNQTNPFIYLIKTQTGSIGVSTLLATGLVIIQIGCNLTVFSSTTRLTWAWARDGGFHSFFGFVEGKSRVPMRAVLLTCLLVTLLSLLNIGTGTYIALGAVTSLCSLALYFSYAVILSTVLYARVSGGYKTSVWSMGRLGLPVNIFALVYTLYTMIWLPFPTILPVTASNMNYCGPVYGFVIVLAIAAWLLWGRKKWPGPNEDIVRIVVNLASKT